MKVKVTKVVRKAPKAKFISVDKLTHFIYNESARTQRDHDLIKDSENEVDKSIALGCLMKLFYLDYLMRYVNGEEV